MSKVKIFRLVPIMVCFICKEMSASLATDSPLSACSSISRQVLVVSTVSTLKILYLRI